MTHAEIRAIYWQEYITSNAHIEFSSWTPQWCGGGGYRELNLYTVLMVPKNATSAIITRSFRILAFAFHPDTCGLPGDDEIQDDIDERFVQITKAGILRDPAIRVQYDSVTPLFTRTLGYGPNFYPQRPWFIALDEAKKPPPKGAASSVNLPCIYTAPHLVIADLIERINRAAP